MLTRLTKRPDLLLVFALLFALGFACATGFWLGLLDPP